MNNQFVEWFNKVFVTVTSNLEGSKLLIFDGHSSHMWAQVVKLALENNAELFWRYSDVDKKAFPELLKSLINSGAFSTSNAIRALEQYIHLTGKNY